ncbi:hypothetical protein [Nocardioides yefusunii]|uniref:Uncharacterized protein n=1 Tax=Nocardioides yefusunii TaxID=2500546 RepID=A0ABW1R0D5_9ACTN|nr:hypothetical protein [Nocardioides yefusunii]
MTQHEAPSNHSDATDTDDVDVRAAFRALTAGLGPSVDAIVAGSAARGRTLRRRRTALRVALPLAVASVVVPMTLLVTGTDDATGRDDTTRAEPAPSRVTEFVPTTEPTPTAEPTTEPVPTSVPPKAPTPVPTTAPAPVPSPEPSTVPDSVPVPPELPGLPTSDPDGTDEERDLIATSDGLRDLTTMLEVMGPDGVTLAPVPAPTPDAQVPAVPTPLASQSPVTSKQTFSTVLTGDGRTSTLAVNLTEAKASWNWERFLAADGADPAWGRTPDGALRVTEKGRSIRVDWVRITGGRVSVTLRATTGEPLLDVEQLTEIAQNPVWWH